MPHHAPSGTDLRRALDDLLPRFAAVPDEAWGAPAHGLTWSCRETAAHLMDDFTYYALQLAGATPPADHYVELTELPPATPSSPPLLILPEPSTGTAGIVEVLDATGGLLVAVTLTAPPERRGYHPRGASDAGGFAAMGITELVLHAFDILTALGEDYRAEPQLCTLVLDRLFRVATRTDDPWQDLLAASGRTPETRGRPWSWDSSVPHGVA